MKKLILIITFLFINKYFNAQNSVKANYKDCVTLSWSCNNCYQTHKEESQDKSDHYEYELKIINKCSETVEVFIVHGGAKSAKINPVGHKFTIEPNKSVEKICEVWGWSTEIWNYKNSSSVTQNNPINQAILYVRKVGDASIKFPNVSITDHAEKENKTEKVVIPRCDGIYYYTEGTEKYPTNIALFNSDGTGAWFKLEANKDSWEACCKNIQAMILSRKNQLTTFQKVNDCIYAWDMPFTYKINDSKIEFWPLTSFPERNTVKYEGFYEIKGNTLYTQDGKKFEFYKMKK